MNRNDQIKDIVVGWMRLFENILRHTNLYKIGKDDHGMDVGEDIIHESWPCRLKHRSLERISKSRELYFS